MMERVTLLSAETIIGPETLQRLCLPQPSAPPKSPLSRADREVPEEDARIAQALRLTGGNVVRAARLLGLSRDAVRYRMRKYGLALPFPQLSPSVTGEDGDTGDHPRLSSTSAPVLPFQREADAAGCFGPPPHGLRHAPAAAREPNPAPVPGRREPPLDRQ